MFRAIHIKKIINFFIFISISIFLFFVVKHYYSEYLPLEHTEIIHNESKKYDLPPELICGIIRQESRFNKTAVSRKGASGLMQIMEDTAYWCAQKMGIEDFNYERDIFNPEINIKMGTWYLNHLINEMGDVNLAIISYNAGIGNVSRWLNEGTITPESDFSEIPFAETEKYIGRVLFFEKVYKVILEFDGGQDEK